MASSWYVSSAVYSGLTLWTTLGVHAVNDIIRPTSPATSRKWVYKCSAITTGISGATEPTWNNASTNNSTIVDGGVTWKNITGQSATAWTSPAGDTGTITGQATGSPFLTTGGGDTTYVSSDHAETGMNGSGSFSNATTSAILLNYFISVNRAGSTPPVAADITTGASWTFAAGTANIDANIYAEGFTITCSGTLNFSNNNNNRLIYLKNCAIAAGANVVQSNSGGHVFWENTTVQCSAIASPGSVWALDWFNTPNAITATVPTTLFTNGTTGNISGLIATLWGVDLSAMGSGKNLVQIISGMGRYLFANCKLGASVSITTGSVTNADGPIIELVNCDSSNTNYNCTIGTRAGAVTTDTSTTLSGGASDGTTSFSRKMVSSANTTAYVCSLDGFTLDIWNTATGSGKTATVEIISSGTLQDADVFLDVEYLGNASFPISSKVTSQKATILTTAANLTTSSATWNNAPATPVKQQLITPSFTPNQIGLIRGTVRLNKASTTLWYDPRMTIA